METERWRRITEIYQAALDLPEAQRGGFLAKACGAEEDIRREVESLLSEAEVVDDEFLDAPPFLHDSEAVDDQSGQDIGPFRLVKLLGGGGMGRVFLAEQSEPIRRRVALKIIKRGMDTREFIARFKSERQALALMEHPHIAKVFDAGETGEGRPFFAMELVDGIPVTEYCDLHRLTLDGRLELFLQICAALQHAHQKGVVHRDIKPSNVLVEHRQGKPWAKVIDFGLAKATSATLTDRTLQTRFGTLMGTPDYLSPEQADMSTLDIDTRADIYSLGALLYELLTGTPPFDPKRLREGGLEQMRRIIREEDPPAMSARIKSLGDGGEGAARVGQNSPTGLRKRLLGDLDWICAKAMEKERTRRFQSVSEMAAEIRRHLRDEPLQRPAGWAYRAGKFARRHKLLVASTVAVFLTLLSLAGLGWEAMRARHEADLRRRNAEQLISHMLGEQKDDLVAKGDLKALSEVAGRALRYFVDLDLPESDLSDADLEQYAEALQMIGDAQLKSGEREKALEAFRQSLELARIWAKRNPGAVGPFRSMYVSRQYVGSTLRSMGDVTGALREWRACLEDARSALDRDPSSPDFQGLVAEAFNGVGNLLRDRGDLDNALVHFESAVQLRRQLALEGQEDAVRMEDLANALSFVGSTQGLMARFLPSIGPLQEALAIRKRLLENDPNHTEKKWVLALSHHRMGEAFENLGDLDKALQQFGAKLSLMMELNDSEPSNIDWKRDLGVTHIVLARAYRLAHRAAEAQAHLRTALSTFGELRLEHGSSGDWNRATAVAHELLGKAYLQKRQYTDAKRSFNEASVSLGPALPQAAPSLKRLRADLLLDEGEVEAALGNATEAERHFNLALQKLDSLVDRSKDWTVTTSRVRALLLLGRPAEARPLAQGLRETGFARPDFVDLCKRGGIW